MHVSITITAPKSLVNLARLKTALEDGLDDSAQKVYTNLQKPTSTWKHKVAFQIKKLANGRLISTGDAIYGYVNSGTRPHIIRAKNAKYLNFGPSTPKTSVGSLDSGAGSRGPRDTFRTAVRHPGTDARRFDKAAAEIAKREYPARMRQAVREGVR